MRTHLCQGKHVFETSFLVPAWILKSFGTETLFPIFLYNFGAYVVEGEDSRLSQGQRWARITTH